MRVQTFLFALCVASISAHVRADTPPSVWTRAAVPDVRSERALHEEARRTLLRLPPDPEDPFRFAELGRDDRLFLLLAKLQRIKASPLLTYDLGEVYEQLGMHQMAIQVLRPLVEAHPSEPFTEDAWLTLAYAYAHTEDPIREREAYRHYLQTAKHPRSRAIATLNLAEAEMRLGELEPAIEGYRAALERANADPLSQETAILAIWGLTVALDRYHDRRGSTREADRVIRIDPGLRLISQGENVFFAPKWERHWYLGLGWMAMARAAQTPNEKGAAWLRAASAWQAYVNEAAAEDPWKVQAQAHLEDSTRELKKVQKHMTELSGEISF